VVFLGGFLVLMGWCFRGDEGVVMCRFWVVVCGGEEVLRRKVFEEVLRW
jgi:hypothetical protein